MACYPRLIMLYVGVLAHVVRCFLRAPAAVYPSRKELLQAAPAAAAAATRQPVPRALFIAVLRDVQPERVQEVAHALYRGGFRMMSVTADTPSFGTVLRRIAEEDLQGLTVGASSVTSEQEVELAVACGAKFISSTYCDVGVVRRTKECGMISIPGVSTPAQARGAVQAGGDIVKAFPAKDVSTSDFRSIVGSVPSSVPVIISGGVEVKNLEEYSGSGACGFAVGRTLFEPEMPLAEIEAKACRFIAGGRRLRWARRTDEEAFDRLAV